MNNNLHNVPWRHGEEKTRVRRQETGETEGGDGDIRTRMERWRDREMES